MINRDTIVCISIAGKPGNFGAVVFNTAFEELSMNYIYKPFKIEPENVKDVIMAIRTFRIRGCGVSMPHKITIMKYLDNIDKKARSIGAINTIVNNKGILTGYNTDYEAAKILTRNTYNTKGKDIVIAGAGGVARSIVTALKENGAKKIVITNRNEVHGKKFAEEFKIIYIPWNRRANLTGDLLINATPIGMKFDDRSIFEDTSIKLFETVLDVVVSFDKTNIIKRAQDLNKKVIPGVMMASLQGMIQFKLYTGLDLPKNVIEKSMNLFLTGKK